MTDFLGKRRKTNHLVVSNRCHLWTLQISYMCDAGLLEIKRLRVEDSRGGPEV